ncbi:Hypothetical_protein [Hexamita inflata]|uniref:Hypothetical_protein n=1 Tax=Hexamita inflata TaxID=28002 RepID=A0AA86QIJ1_9EUKA|nr:Hypothetical protein HINF_LOCUS47631 [Hexamita inflata]
MKPVERLVEVRSNTDVQIVCQSCVKGRKTHRTSKQLVTFEISLRIAAVISSDRQRQRLVESGLRVCPNSQTSNSRDRGSSARSRRGGVCTASGPLWVSRMGKEDSALSGVTVRNRGA